jgi:hypothetical protein
MPVQVCTKGKPASVLAHPAGCRWNLSPFHPQYTPVSGWCQAFPRGNSRPTFCLPYGILSTLFPILALSHSVPQTRTQARHRLAAVPGMGAAQSLPNM